MKADRSDQVEKSIPFYPDHVKTEFKVMVFILIGLVIIGVLGLFFPVGLGDQADPMNTPTHVKPEWYFLSLYQLLKYIPKSMGVILPILAVIGLIVLPFIDKKPDLFHRQRYIRFGIAAVIILVLAGLSIWGEVS